MIKIDGDIFYISAGETCYIFKIENGIPMHVYFGARVEPEDDLKALGYDGKTPELAIGGALVFEHADVTEKDEQKTLVVELADKKSKLKASMYYTPHSRGGVFRTVVIHNGGKSASALSVGQTVSCYGANVVNDMGGLFVAVCCGENSGDAYGFLCTDGDGNITVNDNGTVTAACDITIEAGAEYACPKLLCVYSDIGAGGMSRIFHDVLRENFDETGLAERCSAVLFLPARQKYDIPRVVKAAVGMGFGVVALDGGSSTVKDLNDLADQCKEQGIRPGVRVRREYISMKSVLFNSACKKSGDGYKCDHTQKTTAELAIAVLTAVDSGAAYVMIEADEAAERGAVFRGLFALKSEIKKEQADVRVDFGIRSDGFRHALALCYPVGKVRNLISPLPAEDFKDRFDNATLGTLGYEFDPLEISDGISRAVRAQILSYQDDALTVMCGDIYRHATDSGICRIAVSKDKSRAYAVCDIKRDTCVKLVGLDEHNLYHVHEPDKTFSGAALVHCGIMLEAGTHVLHIRQVADY